MSQHDHTLQIKHSLRMIFENSRGKTAQRLFQEISAVGIPCDLKECIGIALMGDNRELNAWLFNPNRSTTEIVWVSPIVSNFPEYVWMLGTQNETSLRVRDALSEKKHHFSEDADLRQILFPPPLLFVDPIAISKTSPHKLGMEDEFAIFQTSYSKTPDEVSDLDQRMVVNARHAVEKRLLAMNRMTAATSPDLQILRCLNENIELFSILHSEGHNNGHFVGAWPFEDTIKKHCVIYEAVEEFKACLASILIADYILGDNVESDAYALSVFMARFFGYGYEAYKITNRRREIVREVTVGLLFFEWLKAQGAIAVSQSGVIKINYPEIRPCLKRAYQKINLQESFSGFTDEGLRKIAISWYELAFPASNYSSEARLVYTRLNSKGGD